MTGAWLMVASMKSKLKFNECCLPLAVAGGIAPLYSLGPRKDSVTEDRVIRAPEVKVLPVTVDVCLDKIRVIISDLLPVYGVYGEKKPEVQIPDVPKLRRPERGFPKSLESPGPHRPRQHRGEKRADGAPLQVDLVEFRWVLQVQRIPHVAAGRPCLKRQETRQGRASERQEHTTPSRIIQRHDYLSMGIFSL